MPRLGKRVRAHCALERLFPSVHPNVRSHIGGLMTCVSTVGTVVKNFPGARRGTSLMSSGLAIGRPAVPTGDGR